MTPGLSNTVLVAEDEPNIRDTTAFILELEGFEVKTAEDGIECLAAAQKWRPRVILLDLMMPRKNGYDVCRSLRQGPPPLSQVHIIMLTAKGLQKDRQMAMEAGANEFMTKPIKDDILVGRLREIFKGSPPP